jgi:hypothetical protein
VEADELVGVQLKPGELGQEFLDFRGLAGVELVFGGFQMGKELVRIMRSGRHSGEIV